LKDW